MDRRRVLTLGSSLLVPLALAGCSGPEEEGGEEDGAGGGEDGEDGEEEDERVQPKSPVEPAN
ncbi:hypothetical protein G9C85_15760 [Halorubellus sp. JP-L1]|uniref:hypothetical protein n=1 Tax=Halorubellus sp. JP-L1 TaxID=2715753 RepID=UPI00140886D2|nr:hypothetical protein [Halorubellus sp. JP-L1]NHN43073.1 hypothetical protein [Halorubellus sp. JP-L1]